MNLNGLPKRQKLKEKQTGNWPLIIEEEKNSGKRISNVCCKCLGVLKPKMLKPRMPQIHSSTLSAGKHTFPTFYGSLAEL